MMRLGKTFTRSLVAASLGVSITSIVGRHSAFINATVVNHTGRAVKLLEVDYPNASFGTQDLAVDRSYQYHFKVIGSGPTKVEWTDTQQKDHTATGPNLSEGQQGELTITLEVNAATWHVALKP